MTLDPLRKTKSGEGIVREESEASTNLSGSWAHRCPHIKFANTRRASDAELFLLIRTAGITLQRHSIDLQKLRQITTIHRKYGIMIIGLKAGTPLPRVREACAQYLASMQYKGRGGVEARSGNQVWSLEARQR